MDVIGSTFYQAPPPWVANPEVFARSGEKAIFVFAGNNLLFYF